jgi:hypothetical protein
MRRRAMYPCAMPKRATAFNPALEPISQPLPATIAESIGRTISRHSYLEWILGQVLYSLLEISIKQGRKVVQRPDPRQYVAAVQGLYVFHKLQTNFNFNELCRKVEAADRARDALAHSVYMEDVGTRGNRVHLVRGSWANGADEQQVSRDAWPDAPVLDRTLLNRLRDEVEAAVKMAEKLRSTTDDLLRKLHEARRTNPQLNRRRSDR